MALAELAKRDGSREDAQKDGIARLELALG
jgi:hypothetical protein